MYNVHIKRLLNVYVATGYKIRIIDSGFEDWFFDL